MKLYRIEHKETLEGMWTKKFGDDLVLNFLTNDSLLNMPMLKDEIFRTDDKIWKTGVPNLKLLYSWFSKQDIMEMINHGFLLKEIESDDLIIQPTQILFNDSSRISEKNITEIFKNNKL